MELGVSRPLRLHLVFTPTGLFSRMARCFWLEEPATVWSLKQRTTMRPLSVLRQEGHRTLVTGRQWRQGRTSSLALPRPYLRQPEHSVALLLQDGRVAVMGGFQPFLPPHNDPAILPWSRVEIYNPGYTFESSRLTISATQSAAMSYGMAYYITVNRPGRVAYACLIGISSITHSFDYGQRYVQLMATQASGPGNIKILGPPVETSAPEGYYLLFAVEIRQGVHIPSKGVFVKLAL